MNVQENTAAPASHLTRTGPSRNELKQLAVATGPCLSILLPLHTTGTNRRSDDSQVRRAWQIAEDKLTALSLKPEEIRAFLEPVKDVLRMETAHRPPNIHAIAIYRSVERMWHYRLPYPVDQTVCVANRFYIRPLLKLITEETEFYILALSQGHSRLIHCTLSESEEIELPPHITTTLSEYAQTDKPDHRLENRSHGGQVGNEGSHQGMVVAFGTGTEPEHKDNQLRHFFNELDKQLQVFLRDRPLPMIVAAVDYQLVMYHEVSEYPLLVEGGVQGAPDGLRGGELHARAIEVLRAHNCSRADRALVRYDKGGKDRISTDLREILRASFDGRVLYLFLAENARHFGMFDETTHEVKDTEPDEMGSEDLLNAAALQTIAHAGEVFVLPPEKMPEKMAVAALMRY